MRPFHAGEIVTTVHIGYDRMGTRKHEVLFVTGAMAVIKSITPNASGVAGAIQLIPTRLLTWVAD